MSLRTDPTRRSLFDLSIFCDTRRTSNLVLTLPRIHAFLILLNTPTQTLRVVALNLNINFLARSVSLAALVTTIKYASGLRSYSKTVHLQCASLGRAPALKRFQQLAGGWCMIVMDDVRDSYRRLSDSLVWIGHSKLLEGYRLLFTNSAMLNYPSFYIHYLTIILVN